MRAARILIALVIVALVAAACAPSPTPEAAEVATSAPEKAEAATPAAEGAAPATSEFQYEDEWGVVVVKKGDPIRIGFSAALSGAGLDVLGIDEQRGAELAVKDKGEILGFGIELVSEDDLCSAEGGVTVANKFVSDPSIVAVVGPMCSHGCIAATDIFEENHYTFVSPSCTAVVLSEMGSDVFNRVCWSDKIQAPFAAKFIREQLGLERIATIHDGSPYGEGLVNAVAEAFEEMGGTVVAQEAVNVGDTDMRPLLERIKGSDPQLIYFGGFPAEGAFLASQRIDVGMEDVVFMGADGIKAKDFIEAAGEAAEGVYASAADFAEAGPGLADFLAEYKSTYGEEPPGPFHAHGYDATMLILNAIEQAGKVDPEGNLHIGRKALSEAVRGTKDYQGISGHISCDENGDCGTGSVAISVVKGGEYQTVWPE